MKAVFGSGVLKLTDIRKIGDTFKNIAQEDFLSIHAAIRHDNVSIAVRWYY